MMSKFTKRFAEIYVRMICLNVKIEPRRILFLRTSLRIISLGRRFSILMYLGNPPWVSFPKNQCYKKGKKESRLWAGSLVLCILKTWLGFKRFLFWNHGLVPFVTEVPGSSKRKATKNRGRTKTASHPRGFERCQHPTKVNEPHGFVFLLFSSENPDSILWLQHLTQSSSIVCLVQRSSLRKQIMVSDVGN